MNFLANVLIVMILNLIPLSVCDLILLYIVILMYITLDTNYRKPIFYTCNKKTPHKNGKYVIYIHTYIVTYLH